MTLIMLAIVIAVGATVTDDVPAWEPVATPVGSSWSATPVPALR